MERAGSACDQARLTIVQGNGKINSLPLPMLPTLPILPLPIRGTAWGCIRTYFQACQKRGVIRARSGAKFVAWSSPSRT